MKATVIWILVFVLLAAGQTALADYDQLIRKIDAAWNQRSGNTADMNDALAWAEQAYGEKPGFEPAWRAARASFWICDRTDDKDTDVKYGLRGMEWANRAIKANPDAVQGHYFYTICLGEYGKGLSIVTALAKGLGPKFEKANKKAIAIDGGYDNAGPYRALGRYYFKLPWPRYSAEKALENFNTALKIAPKQARTYVYIAEMYIKEKQYDKARQTLEQLAGIESGYSDAAFDHKYYTQVGKDLSEQIKGK